MRGHVYSIYSSGGGWVSSEGMQGVRDAPAILDEGLGSICPHLHSSAGLSKMVSVQCSSFLLDYKA